MSEPPASNPIITGLTTVIAYDLASVPKPEIAIKESPTAKETLELFTSFSLKHVSIPSLPIKRISVGLLHSSVKLVHSTTQVLASYLQHTANLSKGIGDSVTDMLHPLLGQVGHLADRAHDLASGVLQFVGGLSSGTPGGSHNPGLTYTPQASVIPKAWTRLPQLARSSSQPYSGRTGYVIAQFVRSLSSGYQEPRGNIIKTASSSVIAPVRTQISASAQAADPPQQKPVVSSQASPSQQKLPTIPAGNIPASTAMLGGSGSFGGSSSPVLLVAILVAGSILLRGGASSWLSGNFCRPASVFSPAIERPG